MTNKYEIVVSDWIYFVYQITKSECRQILNFVLLPLILKSNICIFFVRWLKKKCWIETANILNFQISNILMTNHDCVWRKKKNKETLRKIGAYRFKSKTQKEEIGKKEVV